MLDNYGCSWTYGNRPVTKRGVVKVNIARVSLKLVVAIQPPSTSVRIRIIDYKAESVITMPH